MPQDLASYTASMLEKYYKVFSLPKKVVKELDLHSIIHSFKLPSDVGDYLLGDECAEIVHSDFPTIKLHLKDETNSSILDLGMQS